MAKSKKRPAEETAARPHRVTVILTVAGILSYHRRRLVLQSFSADDSGQWWRQRRRYHRHQSRHSRRPAGNETLPNSRRPCRGRSEYRVQTF